MESDKVSITQTIFNEWVEEQLDLIRTGETSKLRSLNDYVVAGLDQTDLIIVKRFAGRTTHVLKNFRHP